MALELTADALIWDASWADDRAQKRSWRSMGHLYQLRGVICLRKNKPHCSRQRILTLLR